MFGGAVSSLGSLALTDSQLCNNFALLAGSGQTTGGAAFANLLIDIKRTIFDSNIAMAINSGLGGTVVKRIVLQLMSHA